MSISTSREHIYSGASEFAPPEVVAFLESELDIDSSQQPELWAGFRALRRRQLEYLLDKYSLPYEKPTKGNALMVLCETYWNQNRFPRVAVVGDKDVRQLTEENHQLKQDLAELKGMVQSLMDSRPDTGDPREETVEPLPIPDEIPDDFWELKAIATSHGVNTFGLGTDDLKTALNALKMGQPDLIPDAKKNMGKTTREPSTDPVPDPIPEDWEGIKSLCAKYAIKVYQRKREDLVADLEALRNKQRVEAGHGLHGD